MFSGFRSFSGFYLISFRSKSFKCGGVSVENRLSVGFKNEVLYYARKFAVIFKTALVS